MSPYSQGYEAGISGISPLLVFWTYAAAEAWCTGYCDGLADRALARPSARRHEVQVTTLLDARS